MLAPLNGGFSLIAWSGGVAYPWGLVLSNEVKYWWISACYCRSTRSAEALYVCRRISRRYIFSWDRSLVQRFLEVLGSFYDWCGLHSLCELGMPYKLHYPEFITMKSWVMWSLEGTILGKPVSSASRANLKSDHLPVHTQPLPHTQCLSDGERPSTPRGQLYSWSGWRMNRCSVQTRWTSHFWYY